MSIRFVIRLKDGESMAFLCREFGNSRKAGYKIFEHYEQCGWEGLTDRTRRAASVRQRPACAGGSGHGCGEAREAELGCAQDSRAPVAALALGDQRPARSTIHAILDRHGLVSRVKRSRTHTEGTPLSECAVVHRLQGRVQASNNKYCLSAHGDSRRLIS